MRYSSPMFPSVIKTCGTQPQPAERWLHQWSRLACPKSRKIVWIPVWISQASFPANDLVGQFFFFFWCAVNNGILKNYLCHSDSFKINLWKEKENKFDKENAFYFYVGITIGNIVCICFHSILMKCNMCIFSLLLFFKPIQCRWPSTLSVSMCEVHNSFTTNKTLLVLGSFKQNWSLRHFHSLFTH